MAEAEEKEFCSNCKRDIAKVNFVMHEVHCRRNIVLCDKCNEPIPRSETEEHFNEYHAPVKCPQCLESVEVSAIDKHKVEKCSKRPVHCQYCELQLPFCDINKHTSYCGTRTEQCPSCGTFVMIKNQDSHQGEECLVIQASAASAPRNDTGGNDATSNMTANDFDSDYQNSFAMNELSRMLNMARTRDDASGTSASRSRPAASTRTMSTGTFYGSGASRQAIIKPKRNSVPKSRNSDNSSGPREWNNSTNTTTSTHRRTAPRTTVNSIQRNKRTNEQSGNYNRTHRNFDRPQSNLTTGGNINDLDHLLAMHLAEDLNGEIDLDTYSRDHPNPRDFTSENVFSDDLELPCEFCGNQLPVSLLYDHQSGCDLNPSNSNLNNDVFSRETDIQPPSPQSMVPNNSSSRQHSTNSHQTPSIVDNLAYLAATDMLNNDAGATELSVDSNDVMLPCEFCDNLFPEDVIIQHQAVCDANLTQTPKRMSPVLSRRPGMRQMRHRSPGSHDAGAVGGSRRRQQDPFIGLGLGLSASSKTSSITSSQTDSRGASGKRPVASKNSSQHTPSYNTSRNRNRQPRGSYFARPLAEDTSHLDNYEVECGGSRTERRRRSSTARTRETLDQLIQDSADSNLEEHPMRLSKEQKSRMNQTTRQIDGSVEGITNSDRAKRGARGISSVKSRTTSYEPSVTASGLGSTRRNSKPRTVPRTNVGSELESTGTSLRATKPRKNTQTSTSKGRNSSRSRRDLP